VRHIHRPHSFECIKKLQLVNDDDVVRSFMDRALETIGNGFIENDRVRLKLTQAVNPTAPPHRLHPLRGAL
jgi:hypothetical protein